MVFGHDKRPDEVDLENVEGVACWYCKWVVVWFGGNLIVVHIAELSMELVVDTQLDLVDILHACSGLPHTWAAVSVAVSVVSIAEAVVRIAGSGGYGIAWDIRCLEDSRSLGVWRHDDHPANILLDSALDRKQGDSLDAKPLHSVLDSCVP